jgi:hypothetical protein
MGFSNGPIGTGGSSLPPLPEGYEWRKDVTSSDLQLWKSDVTPNVLITSANVGEFDVNGSLRAAINTIYLEQAHSIKSSGEEVVFQNLESKVFYTPVWQFTSEDGESIGEASVLVEAEAPTDYYQNGLVAAASTSVACQDVYTTTENGTVYQFHAESAEAYTGKLSLELRNSLGDAVFRLEKDVSLSIGDDVAFDKLLYRVRIGNVRTFRLVKAGGNELQVRGGLNPLKPWVKVVYRGFSDRAIIHEDESGKVPTAQLPQIDTIERNTVANQSARLALPVSSKFRITIQSDVQRQFYLDPNANPAVIGNWVDGGSVASAVTSFNSRTGNVTPQNGDYTAAQVGAVAAPASDGVRRVLVGSTPTAESIVDNLTSTSATSPLSANMGRQLKAELDAATGGPAAHVKLGYDLVVSSNPKAVFRDTFLTSGTASTSISAVNIPWVYADIEAAERSLPFWIQKLTTFFKNLENDAQFDQLIGAIPSQFAIPVGSWGVPPSSSTDMDNQFGSATTYGSEHFELIVGRNAAATSIYTFGFTFAQFANGTYDTTCLYPFRIIYQTTRQTNVAFSGSAITSISSSAPRCTARGATYTTGGSAFPLMFEPICLEIDK